MNGKSFLLSFAETFVEAIYTITESSKHFSIAHVIAIGVEVPLLDGDGVGRRGESLGMCEYMMCYILCYITRHNFYFLCLF